MSLAKLEAELLKVKENIGKVKEVNSDFDQVITEMSILKERSIANPRTKDQIATELKNKEILDLFASVEKDFDEIKAGLAKQSIEREKISDFVESMRTKKSFSFESTATSVMFLENIVNALESDIISIKPEYIGMLDLGQLAIDMGLHKSGSSVIVEKERFSEALAVMLNKKLLHNIVFETDNAKITLKASNTLIVESENANLRKIIRLSKQ